MNKSIARDRHFNMSKLSKMALATLVGQERADVKAAFVAAEIGEEVSRREPYSEDLFFGKADRKAAKEARVKEIKENKSNKRNRGE